VVLVRLAGTVEVVGLGVVVVVVVVDALGAVDVGVFEGVDTDEGVWLRIFTWEVEESCTTTAPAAMTANTPSTDVDTASRRRTRARRNAGRIEPSVWSASSSNSDGASPRNPRASVSSRGSSSKPS
jgi:hypothetical protein